MFIVQNTWVRPYISVGRRRYGPVVFLLIYGKVTSRDQTDVTEPFVAVSLP